MDKIVEWWRDKNDESITDVPIDPAEHYWLAMHVKKFNGVWEYAIVEWSHHYPHLVALFRDGKKLAGDES